MYTWLKRREPFSDVFQISSSHKEEYIRGYKFGFSLLRSLNSETKKLLSPKMDQLIQKEADIRFALKEFKLDIALSSVFVPYTVSALVTPLLMSRMHELYPTAGGWIAIYILHILLSALLIIGVLAVLHKHGLGKTLIRTSIVIVLLFTFLQFLPHIININSEYSVLFFYHLFTSITGGLLSILVFGGIIFVTGIWLVVSQQKRKESRAPIAIVVERLYDTLYGLEQRSDRCTELESKRDLLERLGKVANLIEYSIPKLMESSDDCTNYWSQRSFARIAATFRALNKSIVTPQQQTAEQLINSLAKYLELIILGRWGEIDQTEPEQLNLGRRGWLRIKGIVGGVILGIVPFLVILIIQAMGAGIERSVFDYFKIGTIIWAILSITLTLDPQFRDKIASFKDLVSIGNYVK